MRRVPPSRLGHAHKVRFLGFIGRQAPHVVWRPLSPFTQTGVNLRLQQGSAKDAVPVGTAPCCESRQGRDWGAKAPCS
jgi:hypothetical protein